MEAASPKGIGLRYWLFVLVLVALGFVAIFSFGRYLWLMALGLILLSPFRSRPTIFLPGIALFLGFLVGYVLVAPWGCSQSFSSNPTTGEETVSPVVCVSPVGIEYPGPEPFESSRTPALIAGTITGVVAAAAIWAVARSRNDRERTLVDV